eukprot:CAMPEP_0114568590 /NCGR_PEP_ID=MMETSP0114-20121206/16144_1 /TAXON_ID=31324 /ORGANISM="Goniomonas sp, Strain m" /LENGTH=291 /DNA_ID=CAMNT_0001755353 /DNA_START=216 /DNA_END=1088 /DNA_ORIENTATION=+
MTVPLTHKVCNTPIWPLDTSKYTFEGTKEAVNVRTPPLEPSPTKPSAPYAAASNGPASGPLPYAQRQPSESRSSPLGADRFSSSGGGGAGSPLGADRFSSGSGGASSRHAEATKSPGTTPRGSSAATAAPTSASTYSGAAKPTSATSSFQPSARLAELEREFAELRAQHALRRATADAHKGLSPQRPGAHHAPPGNAAAPPGRDASPMRGAVVHDDLAFKPSPSSEPPSQSPIPGVDGRHEFPTARAEPKSESQYSNQRQEPTTDFVASELKRAREIANELDRGFNERQTR